MSLKSSYSIKISLNSDAIVHNGIHELSFCVNFALSENVIQQKLYSKTKFKQFLKKYSYKFLLSASIAACDLPNFLPAIFSTFDISKATV